MLNVSFNLTDETALSSANITANFSSGRQSINYTVSGLTSSIEHNFSVDCGRGCVINFTAYATDSSNNVGQNSRLVTISNTAPIAPTILYPTNNLLVAATSISLNITYPADVDADSITSIRYYINGTLNSTSTGNSSFNASNGKFNLSVSLFDGFEWSSNTTVASFKLDTVNPTDNLLVVMPNITVIGRDKNFTVTSSDDNLFGHNVTCTNQAGAIQFSQEVTGINSITNDIVVQVNASWGAGRYKCTSNESDDHTVDKIAEEDYISQKEVETVKAGEEKYKLSYSPDAKNEISISLIEIRSDGVKKEISELGTEDFGDVYDGDRKKFFWLLDDAAAKLKSKGTEQITTVHELNTQKKIFHRPAYSFPSFVSGSQWIDLRLCDEDGNQIPASYNTIKSTDLSYKVEVTAETLERRFCSIGGINYGSSETELIIDLTPPVINNITPHLANNTLNTALSVNYTLNASESFNQSILAYINGAKNLTIGSYQNNVSRNFSLDTSGFGDGNFTVKFELNDSAGNKVNSSLFAFRIDRTAPSITDVMNRTLTNGKVITTADNINFSLTVNDTNLYAGNISTNASGTWVNYSLSLNGIGNYYVTVGGLKGGTFAWIYHIFDILGNKAESSQTFIVSKISTNVTMSNNGWMVDVVNQSPIKSLAIGINGTPFVYVNGSLVSQDVNNNYPVGYYNFSAVIPTNDTVIGSMVTYFITILPPSSSPLSGAGGGAGGSGGQSSYSPCGNNLCDYGETVFSCPKDCSPQTEGTSNTTSVVEAKSFKDKILDAITPDKQSTLPDGSSPEEEKMSKELKIAVTAGISLLAILTLITVALLL